MPTQTLYAWICFYIDDNGGIQRIERIYDTKTDCTEAMRGAVEDGDYLPNVVKIVTLTYDERENVT